MSLLAILLILFLGGAAAWASSLLHPRLPRWIALLSVIGAMLPLVTVLGEPIASDGGWLIEYNLNWIPSLGIRFSLALDGLSALLVALTGFLGIVAINLNSPYPYSGHNREMTVDEVVILLTAAGFNIRHIDTYNFNPYSTITKKGRFLKAIQPFVPIKNLGECILAVAKT